MTAAELSADLGVSLRTLNRDLRLLRDSGIPIESDRGRGGGLRLHRNWPLGRLHLSPAEEMFNLPPSIAIAERMNSALLLRQLTPIKRKIVAAFSETHQLEIRSLRKRILVGRPASARVMASFAPPQHRALTGITSREVEPQFLYLSVPVWYLLRGTGCAAPSAISESTGSRRPHRSSRAFGSPTRGRFWRRRSKA